MSLSRKLPNDGAGERVQNSFSRIYRYCQTSKFQECLVEIVLNHERSRSTAGCFIFGLNERGGVAPMLPVEEGGQGEEGRGRGERS